MQPLQVPTLDEKDVVDQLADGLMALAGLDGGFEGGRVRGEPPPPLVPFLGGVLQQLVDRQLEEHPAIVKGEVIVLIAYNS